MRARFVSCGQVRTLHLAETRREIVVSVSVNNMLRMTTCFRSMLETLDGNLPGDLGLITVDACILIPR